MEKIMLQTMFKIPSDDKITKVTITHECVAEEAPPLITRSAAKSQTHMGTDTLRPGEYVADSVG
jgi:ATP-dependent protease Clp ATPase subunit